MAWKPDIRDRMRPAHGGQIPPELERYYWELNLMIHLLDGYTYGQMSGHTVSQAMDRFAGRVELIEDIELSNPGQSKPRLKGILTAIDAVMKLNHPTFTMYDLYTKPVPQQAIRQLVVNLFDTFQKQVGADKIFPDGPARVCMPFLEWQRGGTPANFPQARVDAMDDFIDVNHCRDDSLLDLINTPKTSLSASKATAIANAKAHGILITRPTSPGPSTKTIEFDNKLKCSSTTNHCEPVPSGFCLTATDGTCSAVSG